MINGIIDTVFVENFYRTGADNTMLNKLFENGTKFKVMYPDLLQLTRDLCSEFSVVITVIKQEARAQLFKEVYNR